MAASKVNKPVTKEIDEQILTCIVCLERYKNAKILPCHHSFCKECLEELVSTQHALNCPICRRPCPIPAGGVAKLPPSILVNSIIEIITAQTQDDQGSKCDFCQEGVPINRCIDCSFYVCRNCTNTHVKNPATRHHRIMTLDEYERAKGDNAALAQPSVACKGHPCPENKVDFFCDTCETSICTACAVVKHHGHEHREIKEAAESIRRSLEGKLEQLQVKATELTQNLVQFKTKTQELDETYQREVNIVKKHTLETEQNIARMIREQEGKLLQDLKARYEQSKARMETEGTTLTQMKEGVETTGVFVQSLIRYGEDVQLVSTAAETSANLDEVLTTAVPSTQEVYTLPSFSKRPFTESGILGTLNIHTAIHATIPEDIKVKDTAAITIHSDLLHITSHSLKAEIVKPGSTKGESVPIEHRGTKHACNVIGILSIFFDKDGVFRLSVTLEGDPIRGSPYQITVNRHQWSLHRVVTEGPVDNQFGMICCVRVDSNRHVLVNDMKKHRIYVFDKHLNFQKCLKFSFRGKKPFCPSGIAVSNEDIYYVSDGGLVSHASGKRILGGNNQIVVTNVNGDLIDVINQGKFGDPCDVSLSHNQKVLYVVDGLHHCIYAIPLQSKLMQKIGKLGSGPGEFRHPYSIAVDSKDNLIVSDYGNNRVQLLNAFGSHLRHFGDHERSGARSLSRPLGIVIDRADHVYICDSGNARVLVYNKEGKCVHEISGELRHPSNVCLIDGMQYKMIVGDLSRLVTYTGC